MDYFHLMHLKISDDCLISATRFGIMILDQVDRSDSQDYNSGYQHTDTEMTGMCGELKRRGHHLDTVPEVPTSGQVLPSPPHTGGHNHSHNRLGTNKTGGRCRASMKLELSSGNSVTRPSRALKQRPLALFKARMAQVQQSRSPNRSPCKSPGSSNGQYLINVIILGSLFLLSHNIFYYCYGNASMHDLSPFLVTNETFLVRTRPR